MMGANDPFLWFCAAAVGLCGTMLLGWFALVLPRYALAFCYVIVIIATTKLRVRDASASLAGEFDFQIFSNCACMRSWALSSALHVLHAGVR